MAKYKIQDNMIPTIHRGSEVLYLNYNKPISILIGGGDERNEDYYE